MSQEARILFTSDPDALGRRRMMVVWKDPEGIFRKEDYGDEKPVGYRRGQCFFTTREKIVASLKRDGFRPVIVQSASELDNQ